MRTALVALVALLLLLPHPTTAGAAEPPNATILLTTGGEVHRYGSTMTLTVRMFGPTENRAIRVYATPAGQVERLIADASVDASTHSLPVAFLVRRNTAFRAVFDGDASWGPASGTARVTVPAGLALSSPSRSSTGRFHRLPARSRPAVTGRVTAAPAPPTGCVRAVRYRLVGDRWRRLDTIPCLRRDAENRVRIGLGGFAPGTRLRVAARFGSSTVNTPSPVRWYHVLLT